MTPIRHKPEDAEYRDMAEVLWVYNFLSDYLNGDLPVSPRDMRKRAVVAMVASVLGWAMALEREGMDTPITSLVFLIKSECDVAAGSEGWLSEYNRENYGAPQGWTGIFGGNGHGPG